jgi:hypothetical protein
MNIGMWCSDCARMWYSSLVTVFWMNMMTMLCPCLKCFNPAGVGSMFLRNIGTKLLDYVCNNPGNLGTNLQCHGNLKS